MREASDGIASANADVNAARISSEKHRLIYLFSGLLLLLYIYVLLKIPVLDCLRRIENEVHICHTAHPIKTRGRVPRKLKTITFRGMSAYKNSLDIATRIRS